MVRNYCVIQFHFFLFVFSFLECCPIGCEAFVFLTFGIEEVLGSSFGSGPLFYLITDDHNCVASICYYLDVSDVRNKVSAW